MSDSIVLSHHTPLSAATLYAACRQAAPQVSLDPACHSHLSASAAALDRIIATKAPVYGLNTGYGALVDFAADTPDALDGAQRITHLASGMGPLTPAPVVKATMLLRADTLCRGRSGIAPEIVSDYLTFLAEGETPKVPQIGSVGASGDLNPLAHVALAFDAWRRGRGHAGLPRRAGLALVNGTSYATAWAALTALDAQKILQRQIELDAWLQHDLAVSTECIAAELAEAKPHPGSHAVAAGLRDARAALGATPPKKELQAVYSLRCLPQLLGACQDLVDSAVTMLEREMAGVDDNPLVFPEPDRVLHGGQFFGQHVAFAADMLNSALCQIGLLAERQIGLMMEPATNGDLPPMLTPSPGTSTGLAGLQIAASALAAEIRMGQAGAACSSIPTNGVNQDIVPMAPLAARRAAMQLTRIVHMQAMLAIALVQARHIRGIPLPEQGIGADLGINGADTDVVNAEPIAVLDERWRPLAAGAAV